MSGKRTENQNWVGRSISREGFSYAVQDVYNFSQGVLCALSFTHAGYIYRYEHPISPGGTKIPMIPPSGGFTP